jgi:hypothetical protein
VAVVTPRPASKNLQESRLSLRFAPMTAVRTNRPDAIAASTVIKSHPKLAVAANTLTRRSAISPERSFPARSLPEFHSGRSLHPFRGSLLRDKRHFAAASPMAAIDCAPRAEILSTPGSFEFTNQQ